MFDRIFDFISAAWQWFIPWVIIDIYEEGVILRLGKFHRVIKPGIRFMLPCGIDVCKFDTVVRQTSYLEVQSLTSKDGKPVTLTAILIYTIKDIAKFLLEIDDGETDVQNMCYGVITECVENTNWNDIRTKNFNDDVKHKCRRLCDTYCGVKLLDVRWSDKATARTLRLWND